MDINFNSVSLFLLVRTFPVKILSCEGEDRHSLAVEASFNYSRLDDLMFTVT